MNDGITTSSLKIDDSGDECNGLVQTIQDNSFTETTAKHLRLNVRISHKMFGPKKQLYVEVEVNIKLICKAQE